MATKLNDDSTIIAIAAVALAALALLITAMKLLHTSIAKVMRDTVSSRSGQSYLGGTRALFGKKGVKGDRHVLIHTRRATARCHTGSTLSLHMYSLVEEVDDLYMNSYKNKGAHFRGLSTVSCGGIHIQPWIDPSGRVGALSNGHGCTPATLNFSRFVPRPNITTPGKIHVEGFDGVGDGDATPMASPIKRYDGGSSPKKTKRQEEEDTTESDELLAEKLDKPADRGSPKRGSVGSPRSRSPRRQVRTDNDYSDRDEDASDNNDDARARNRSVAASPRSRNRRGRGGGKGEEGNDDDEADAARAAPRSDRDNSYSGGDPEGKRWKTPVSGRSAPRGSRPHKSPRESTSRSRETSPKASRKDYDYDDEGGDGGGDNGASPRNRKGGRKGDWENQVARSKPVQSQPRRRKPNADTPTRGRRRGTRDDDDDDDEG